MRREALLLAVAFTASINLFGEADCFSCFACTNITSDEDCSKVIQCSTNEICYVERHGHDNTTKFTLGCISSQRCPSRRPFSIVGRSVSDRCFECCGSDGCNREMCEVKDIPTAPTPMHCDDDPQTNCSRMSTLVHICSNRQEAKQLCPKYCGLCNRVDGGWADWSMWSQCSKSCGVGSKTRRRTCSKPTPQHGGLMCPGNNTQVHTCFDRACPVHGEWNSWGSWERCSNQCGPGVKKRHRSCTNPTPSLYGRYCLGDGVDFDVCTGHSCGNMTTTSAPTTTQAVHCFDVLNDCSVLNQTTGVCSSPENARKICPEFCGLCSIADGYWADWSSWGTCSTTCGNGTWTRSRTCSNPAPAKGGKPCPGTSTDTGSCSLPVCPVHGQWSRWDDWTQCSKSCGQGLTHRRRTCTDPRPSFNGNYCFGDPIEYSMCLVRDCPVDGGWSVWSGWSSCSATCGSGQMTRQRFCLNPRPEHGGQNCTGDRSEQGACKTGQCQENTIPTILFNAHAVTSTYPSSGQTLVFRTIDSNIGNAYSTSSGKFTAPVNGTYTFTVTLCAYPNSNYAGQFNLVRDGSLVTGLYVYNYRNYATQSATLSVYLKQGQKVWVQSASSSCSSSYPCLSVTGSCQNRFSGSLIHK